MSRSTAAILSCTAWLLAGCASVGTQQPPPAGYGPVVRVLIAEGKRAVDVASRGGFRIESEGGIVLQRSNDPATINITSSRGSLQLYFQPGGTAAAAEGGVYVTPLRSGDVSADGVVYPGRLLVQDTGGTLRLINVLPLEAYLEGVLPHEIGNPGPDAYAALQAQAVAARTYALGRIEKQKGQPFDVFADVQDQVYRGNDTTYRLTTSAVRETRGVVLEYDGGLAAAYYCATCGGHTSDIRLVWPQRESAPYLHGRRDRLPKHSESFCSWTPKFRWRFTFSGKQLGVILRKTLPDELGIAPDQVGSLVDVSVKERSPSGRVRVLEITTTRGVFAVEGDRIRWVLKPDPWRGEILPSTMFDISKQTSHRRLSLVTINGGGNGHGVGMCQNGAIDMARKGYSYRMILEHYYPGTTLARKY